MQEGGDNKMTIIHDDFDFVVNVTCLGAPF